MSTTTNRTQYRFSSEQFLKMKAVGILAEKDEVEFMDGLIVLKQSPAAAQESVFDRLEQVLAGLLPPSVAVRRRPTVKLNDGELQPDLVICAATETQDSPHVFPRNIYAIIDLSDAAMYDDRTRRGRMYARVGLPEYWIVNLTERRIEVYTMPAIIEGSDPGYMSRMDFYPGQHIILKHGRNPIGTLEISDVFK